MRYILLFLLLLSSIAWAQEPQPPSDIAVQLSQVIGNWALQIERQGREITSLQQQVSSLKKQLEAKDAKQKPSSSPADGSSSAQPSIRSKSGGAAGGGEGVQ